jgi:hypothetical protein
MEPKNKQMTRRKPPLVKATFLTKLVRNEKKLMIPTARETVP